MIRLVKCSAHIPTVLDAIIVNKVKYMLTFRERILNINKNILLTRY